jgi:hypothetical protein
MRTQPAYDAIALEYGGNAVFLRPSLRAAIHLESLHGGFPDLLRKIEEFDTLTVWHVITASAGRTATDDLFGYAATQPLSGFAQAAQAPCFELVAALFPKTPEGETTAPSNGDPMPWSEVFGQLYKIATGWLGWTPDTVWNATPQEITDAFEGHMSMLKAIHGSAEEEQANNGPTPEQRKENVELGLDPEFDRAGLAALKELSALREGMII